MSASWPARLERADAAALDATVGHLVATLTDLEVPAAVIAEIGARVTGR